MPLAPGKVSLNVAISLEARKNLKKSAIEAGKTMSQLIEEMIKMMYSNK